MKYKIMDGNEACSYVSYYFTEVAGIYPITPASPMAEYIDKWSGNGEKNFWGDTVSVVEMQSEAGAIAMVHGALQNGSLASTYTASQGLLLMIPNMYKIAGELLPCVINVAARSIATHALSILGDHQDIYAVRPTGFAIFATSSPQQVMDLTAVSYLASIKGSIPFVNFFDGFRTSHELQKVELIDMKKVKSMIDKSKLNRFKSRSLSINNVTRGTNQNDDIYFQISEAHNPYYLALPDIVDDYMKKLSKITKREYHPFDYYGDPAATRVIVAMGSVCETIRDTVDYLISQGEKVGLIEVHLYRPFSDQYLYKVLPNTVSDIAVLDRTKESGSSGPLYLDVKNAISNYNANISVVGGRYGLAGKNTNPYQIKAVYSYLMRDHEQEFTLGIVDDVTHLSLEEEYFSYDNGTHEMLLYGYASDGMVSASKDIIKIIGTHTRAYTQGYFEYDSKKAGGVTRCHLRFGNSPIRATYYVENPSIVVCSKDDYLKKYQMLANIKKDGIFLLNTDKSEKEVRMLFSREEEKMIRDKNIKIYTINASKIAQDFGIGNKINLIMATVIFRISNMIPFDFAFGEIKKSVYVILTNKGKRIIESNLQAIEESVNQINQIKLGSSPTSTDLEKEKNIFDKMDAKEGNKLTVSEVMPFVDGTFPGGLAAYEEKNIAEQLPCYDKENCIMCNQCSLVCPHAVIRPFLLNGDELKKAPKDLKDQCKDSMIKDKNLEYTVGVDFKNCTGCGLCSKVCPGKKGQKAISMEPREEVLTASNIKNNHYLFTNVKEHLAFPINTVKGSQFVFPKFEFSGACAGCGQTPYLKLLTQLFGGELVISNATGCSSIYGGSIPKTPYSVPWANSLFEDNAEFGFGLAVSDRLHKEKIKAIISQEIHRVAESEKEVYASYYKNLDYASSCLLYEAVKKSKNKELLAMKEFIITKSFWLVGGDGWAYDIGFGGLDHVLASDENVNILVLDTEVYSNTGGQMSKSSRIGSVAKFSSRGKKTAKKDLARIALSYPHVYVATVSLGANMNQTIKAMSEAKNHPGPSLIIAYAPCIAQGIVTGITDSILEEKKATTCGYFPLFRYHPETGKFDLDSEADFTKYFDFILGEDRYRVLKKMNPTDYKELLQKNKEEAMKRFEYYQQCSTKVE